MTEQSFVRAIDIMIRAEERHKALFEAWNNADALSKSMGFARFSYDWKTKNVKDTDIDGTGNNDPFSFNLDEE